MKIKEEIWKDIQGHNGLYQVSNLGRIRSFFYNNVRILKQSNTKDGYKKISLQKDRKWKVYLVHRLVAQAFIPNPNNLPQVNHKDEDKTNNCVDNLEFCSHEYNMNYGTRNERMSKTKINLPSRSKPVLQFTLDGTFIKEYPSQKEVERQIGVYHGEISLCCNGKRHSSGGFIWRYKK